MVSGPVKPDSPAFRLVRMVAQTIGEETAARPALEPCDGVKVCATPRPTIAPSQKGTNNSAARTAIRRVIPLSGLVDSRPRRSGSSRDIESMRSPSHCRFFLRRQT